MTLKHQAQTCMLFLVIIKKTGMLNEHRTDMSLEIDESGCVW